MASRFWVPGGNGNWNSTTNWSASSGGSSGASVPSLSLDAIFDGNSGSGTVTINISANCNNFDSSAFTGTISGTATLGVASSFTLGAGHVWSATSTLIMKGAGTNATYTINSAGHNIGNQLTWNTPPGSNLTYNFVNDFISTARFNDINDGTSVNTIKFNGHNSQFQCFLTGNNVTTNNDDIIGGSGTMTLVGPPISGSPSYIYFNNNIASFGANNDFSASTIVIQSTSNAGWVAVANVATETIGTLYIKSSTGVLPFTPTTPTKIGTLKIDGGATIEGISSAANSGGYISIDQVVSNGSAGNLAGLNNAQNTGGPMSISSYTGNQIVTDYMSISGITFTGAKWYAGANSVNGGNNNGIIFSGPPTPGHGSNPFHPIEPIIRSLLFASPGVPTQDNLNFLDATNWE